jgi:uncharacterized membrane protein YdjX (TVP38/TMEM64 family)
MSTPTDTPPAPGPAPTQKNAWPQRPGLSALLLACILASVGIVVGLGRHESTFGAAVCKLLNLPERAKRPTPAPQEGLIYFTSDGAQTVLAANAQHAPTLDQALQQAISQKLPAARVRVEALGLDQIGFYAPARSLARIHTTLTPIEGCPTLNDAQIDTGKDALADELDDFARAWRAFTPALRNNTDLGSRAILRGWLLNALTAGAALALLLSLSPRTNRVIETWDKALDVYARVGPIALLGLLWGTAPGILGVLLVANIGPISDLLHANPAFGWLGYVCVFIVSAGVGFLPTYGQSILGGWVFGLAWGFPGAMLGFVGGSVIGYLIAQQVSHHRVEDLINTNPRAKAVRDALIGQGTWKTLTIVTLIRIPPNSPFALTNLVLASTGVGFVPYIIGTAVGMAPRTFIAVYVAHLGKGTGAKDIQEFLEEQPWWALPAGVLLLAVCLGVVGLIANQALKSVTKPAPANT